MREAAGGPVGLDVLQVPGKENVRNSSGTERGKEIWEGEGGNLGGNKVLGSGKILLNIINIIFIFLNISLYY